MKITGLLLGSFLLAIFNTGFSEDSSEFEEPNDDDLHPVNFFLTSQDEQVVIKTIMCRGWPCPKFSVKKDHTPFVQEREYNSFDIVSATTYGCGNFSTGLMAGYAALFRYRKGKNSMNRDVNMTVPVIVEVSKEGDEDECNEKYKVYLISSEPNSNLPDPIEENMKKERIEKLDVYVRTYTGYTRAEESQLAKLQSDVRSLKLCYNSDRYMVVGYDPPWKTKGRRNEIWIDAKDC